VSTGQPGDTKPKRQVTGGVELPGLDQILEEARLQDEADVEASAPAPAAISNFAPMDPQENILTALLLKPEVAEDPVDLDSMLEGDLVNTTPSQSSTAAPFLTPDPVVEIAGDSMPLELSALDSGPLELLMLDSEPTSSQSGNEVVEIALEASGDDPAPMAAASLPLGVDLWLVEDEDSAGETKADILRRIRAGELGPRDRVSPADPDDDRSWELAELPEFKRYVMLFGRTGAKVRSARGAFWERFRRS
jgi:hypothetical protein